MTHNQQTAQRLAARIVVQIQKSAGKGVQAASRFLASRLKEAVSEPAPRKAVRAAPIGNQKKGGILYYRAATRATLGAAPRKLSGRLRTSIVALTLTPTSALVGASARGMPSRKHQNGFPYPLFLETGKQGSAGAKLGEGSHPFVKPTVNKYKGELRAIVGKPLRVALNKRIRLP